MQSCEGFVSNVSSHYWLEGILTRGYSNSEGIFVFRVMKQSGDQGTKV